MVIWRVLFYFVVLISKSAASSSHNNDLNYYDGSRGRMDRNYYAHDEFFHKYNRQKRTPHSPNLWAKSSESQGVSCPTRLRENSLDTLGDSDRVKEVVHIPCPKRKTSGAKVVASFRGKSAKRHRAAREFGSGGRPGKPAQWLVLPAQNRNPNSFRANPNSGKQDMAGPNWNVKTLESQRMQNRERSMMMRSKYAKDEALHSPTPDSKFKPKLQGQTDGLVPRIPDSVQPGRQLLPVPSIQEYYHLGTTLQPYRNLQVLNPQTIQNQGPHWPQNPFLNGVASDGSHLKPQNNSRHPFPKPAANEIPAYYPTPVSPANPIQMYTLIYNTSMPPFLPTESRNGPWTPGSFTAEFPPGYPHQPRLPKFTTKSFDAVNFKDLPKVEDRTPEPNNQQSYLKYEPVPFPNGPPADWKLVPPPNYQQSPMAEPVQVSSSWSTQALNPGQTPYLEKTTHAYKNLFGKSKKEESKIKLAKLAKPPTSYNQPRAPMDSGSAYSGGGPAEPARFQELPPRVQNSMVKNEMAQPNPEGRLHQGLTPFRQMSAFSGHRYNNSMDMSYILNPPVTMDPNLFTNKAHKVASKFVGSEDITYTPFRGYPPARNDEAFYDRNMKFMGKIDRPPLVNIKKHKWSKLTGKFLDKWDVNVPVGFYSEPVDFHSDVDDQDAESKSARRHRSRQCHRNRRVQREPHNAQART